MTSQSSQTRHSTRETRGTFSQTKFGDESTPEVVVRKRKAREENKKSKSKRGARPLFNETAEAQMQQFLDSLVCQPSEEALAAQLRLLQAINVKIQQDHVSDRLERYNNEQYTIALTNKTEPRLTLPPTMRFRFFEYEKEQMRNMVIEKSVMRYDDALFAPMRASFNALRALWRLPTVEASSMKSWCTTERKTARDAVSAAPFLLPTTTTVITCWRQACAEYVADLDGAPLFGETVPLLENLRLLSTAGDESLLKLVQDFVDLIVAMRCSAIKLSTKVNEQQLNVLRYFHDNLLHKLNDPFETQFGDLLSTLGASQRPMHSAYVLALQLLWNAFGLAIHFRRIDHVPGVLFDVGTSLGRDGGELNAYVYFDHVEMNTLYCILGYAGSRVFNRYASLMSARGNDFHTIVASGIYGNPKLLVNYAFAQKTVGMQSTGANAGTLCYPPPDLFVRMLCIARAVFSPPLKSAADGDRLLDTVSSSVFLEQCRDTLEQYGVAAFGDERMQLDAFRTVYFAMMLRLCCTFAKVLARVRSSQVTNSLMKASSDVIARTVLGKGGSKVMSIRTTLTASHALKSKKK